MGSKTLNFLSGGKLGDFIHAFYAVRGVGEEKYSSKVHWYLNNQLNNLS